MEALACNTPIVATDCPSGPAEILDYGRFGELVPPSDPDALSRAVMRAIRSSGRPQNREAALERFQYERVINQYARLIDEVTGVQSGAVGSWQTLQGVAVVFMALNERDPINE